MFGNLIVDIQDGLIVTDIVTDRSYSAERRTLDAVGVGNGEFLSATYS